VDGVKFKGRGSDGVRFNEHFNELGLYSSGFPLQEPINLVPPRIRAHGSPGGEDRTGIFPSLDDHPSVNHQLDAEAPQRFSHLMGCLATPL
jgi:hypothetical protein